MNDDQHALIGFLQRALDGTEGTIIAKEAVQWGLESPTIAAALDYTDDMGEYERAGLESALTLITIRALVLFDKKVVENAWEAVLTAD